MKPRQIAPLLIVLALAGGGWWWFSTPPDASDTLTATGTIEAVEVVVAAEVSGRVTTISAGEGELVDKNQTLLKLDDTLLNAQRTQAAAAAAAAQSSANAAAANLALLKTAPTKEALAVAQTIVDKAALAVEALQENLDALPEKSLDTDAGRTLRQQLDTARSSKANADAQYALVAAGTNPNQITSSAAQSAAAQAQADAATAAINVLDVQLAKLTLTSPVTATLLSLAVEPGEVVLPGVPLFVLADLARLHVTVYVPEVRYGAIKLGAQALVTVDSYPGKTFPATVTHIADKAEFTPRNTQTTAARKTTVFAIRLSIQNPDSQLKPGMPADVTFAP
jgi:HlyD family secretion protein